jgi:hypothetical protein
MQLTTISFVEHKSSCNQDVMPGRLSPANLLLPGASSCCLGSSSCSCAAIRSPAGPSANGTA